VLEAVFILLEFPSPSRKIFIGSYSPPPLSGSPYRSFSPPGGEEAARGHAQGRRVTGPRAASAGESEGPVVARRYDAPRESRGRRPRRVCEQASSGATARGTRVLGAGVSRCWLQLRVNRSFFCLFARVRMMGLMLHGLLLGLTEANRFFRFPFGSFGKIPNLPRFIRFPGTEQEPNFSISVFSVRFSVILGSVSVFGKSCPVLPLSALSVWSTREQLYHPSFVEFS
jgi:hypothetical protein